MARIKASCLVVFFVTVCCSITLFGQKNYAQKVNGGDDINALKQQIEDLRQEVLILNRKVAELSSAQQGQTDAIEKENIENNTENDKQLEAFESRLNEMEGKLDKSMELYVREKEAQETISKKDNTLNVYAPGLKSLKIGGETRVRFEDDLNFDFDDSEGDGKEFTLLRTRLNFDAEVNRHVRGFVEIQDNRAFGEEADAPGSPEFGGFPQNLAGSGGGTIGNLDRVDVLQSYVDVSLFEREEGDYEPTNLSFRVGRWQMKYGAEKLISPLEWSNQGRAWDGVRMHYERNAGRLPFWVDVFATQLDEDFLTPGRAGADEDKIFTGIYTHFNWRKGHAIEPYFLYRKSSGETALPDGVLAATGRTNEERTTAGVHLEGKLASIPGLAYSGEFASQFGSINGPDSTALDIEDSFGGYAEASYTWEDMPWKPKIGYAFTFASGDDNPDDDKAQTFDQLYPFSHYYLGYIDFQAWQNVISHKFSLSANPVKNMLAKVDFHLFELENKDDAWYGAGGAPNPGFGSAAVSASDADDEIGQEIDVTLKYKLFERFDISLGYSRFFAGNLIKDVLGEDDDADWFYLMNQVKF